MNTVARHAALLTGILVQGTTPSSSFICVEWPSHPHGYDAPIYYWNSAHQAYIWHGADCSLVPPGMHLNCNKSRIMGTEGNDYTAYRSIQGVSLLDSRKRMAFFGSCRITVNTLERDASGLWVFRQNGYTEASAGTCAETNVGDCTGKFASPIRIAAGSEACLSSQRGGQHYRGYFESIKEKLIDGINPVLNMPAMFKAMVDGTLQCDPVDKLPMALGSGDEKIYGVMSWNNSKAIPLFQQVMPKPYCLIEFAESEAGELTVGRDTNHTCMQNVTFNVTGRRLRDSGSAGGKSAVGLLPPYAGTGGLASLSSSLRVELGVWMFVALTVAFKCTCSM